MNKEKQIEEMAIIISGSTEVDTVLYYDALNQAKIIYNAGYRKIPEGAVVLTREEYIELTLAKQSIFKMLDERDTKTRKETAKEILAEVSKHFGGRWLVELYKKYGVEVEDNE